MTSITFDLVLENYWNYYLELEKSLLETKRFVEFSPYNYQTFSMEYLKLLEAVCGEVDSIGKALAKTIDPNFKIDKNQNVNKWWEAIQDHAAFRRSLWSYENQCRAEGISLNDFQVRVLGLYPLQPWKGFKVHNGSNISEETGKKTTPIWWDDFTSVKHRRSLVDEGTGRHNYAKANLGNLLNAMAALYSLNNALLGEIGDALELEKFKDDATLFRERETNLANSEFLGYLGLN